jgi:hypothetical protein
MPHSSSKKNDPDWSQKRETVKLLSLSAAQVHDALKEADTSVNTLTESFTAMVDHMQAINDHLLSLESSEARNSAIAHCFQTSDKIQAAVVAFQFYDRMQQCLEHVASNLRSLSRLVEDSEGPHNPKEWQDFQEGIRARYTMESEKLLFDAIFQGKSVDEALALKEAHQQSQSNNIELF